MEELLSPNEVSLLLNWQERRLFRLAKAGKIPHIVLPDGQIRFEKSEIERLIEQGRRGIISNQLSARVAI